MSDRSLVLVLSNDFSLASAKTSRHLCVALSRLGYGAVGRDTRLVRWAAAEVQKESPARQEAFEIASVSKWTKFINDYGIERIVSLDLNWLFTSQLFIDDERIKGIHSFWFDDLRSYLLAAPMFPMDRTTLDVINSPNVKHHCYGRGQQEELRLLGVEQVFPSPLAAPREYVEQNEPCTEMNRLAFIGNPGLSNPPTRVALEVMNRGGTIDELRSIARQEILGGLRISEPSATWLRESPGVADLMAAATELRLTRPHDAAISLLTEAGQAYPEAFDYLNRGGSILDATTLVKFVNRYDRPSLVHRLWQRGWLDVFGTPEQWAPYGVKAQPTVPFPQLPSVYSRYPAHLNAANCARDATANEKLFEIAACGRASLNLDSPDVRDCYAEDEVCLAESDLALEALAEQIVHDPSAALEMGSRARERTAAEHLWEHRLRKAFA